MISQRVGGIEAAQLRALADALTEVDPEAVVALVLTDTGVLHARIDHPDRRTTWMAISVDAEVLAGIGPAGRTHDR